MCLEYCAVCPLGHFYQQVRYLQLEERPPLAPVRGGIDYQFLYGASSGYGEYNHFGIRNFHIDCGRGIRNRIEDERRTGLDYLTEYWEKENDYSKP